nr:MAG TPA: hypothetical protein [Caudoviricetes sp.]
MVLVHLTICQTPLNSHFPRRHARRRGFLLGACQRVHCGHIFYYGFTQ